MMTTWDDIPSAHRAPPDATPSPSRRRLVELQINRRTVIRSAGVLGMALGSTVLGWLPTGRVPQAAAAVGTYWGNCTIYSYDGVLCIGAPYSGSYCGADGWFRNGNSGGYRWAPITACNNRNAWIWESGRVGWRCADGMRYPAGSSSGTFLICNFVAYRR